MIYTADHESGLDSWRRRIASLGSPSNDHYTHRQVCRPQANPLPLRGEAYGYRQDPAGAGGWHRGLPKRFDRSLRERRSRGAKVHGQDILKQRLPELEAESDGRALRAPPGAISQPVSPAQCGRMQCSHGQLDRSSTCALYDSIETSTPRIASRQRPLQLSAAETYSPALDNR